MSDQVPRRYNSQTYIPISQTMSFASSLCKIFARTSQEWSMVSPTAWLSNKSNYTWRFILLAFKEVIQTPVSRNFELWSHSKCCSTRLGDGNRTKDSFAVALSFISTISMALIRIVATSKSRDHCRSWLLNYAVSDRSSCGMAADIPAKIQVSSCASFWRACKEYSRCYCDVMHLWDK